MKLEGSCHCGAVTFSVLSSHPYPYNLCYCSICRKTAGGGGYAINLGATNDTLIVHGKEHISKYQALVTEADTGESKQSPAQRHFCKTCGSALWVWDPRWPELIHPFASAIDTPLPTPPQRTHLMVDSKASWVPLHKEDADKIFSHYPDESIAQWHSRNGLEDVGP
ncbi:GFA family protein [Pseudomaricurvus alkylphenolicus]|uniref:GFA family protein n=1 Tax=Pseudomaricurvus alkylphenolicus TaxID=1306991 RepID=UPI0014246422|nr:GFA family protein [Pseudomaricurvus alkylphenolicus]NIB43677.1 GFA family protein [Pseudomaricurvus alkylphenolicus]